MERLQSLNLSNYPWLLTGDFNTARFTNEKLEVNHSIINNLALLMILSMLAPY